MEMEIVANFASAVSRRSRRRCASFSSDALGGDERRLRLIHEEQGWHMHLTKIALGELDPVEGEGEGD